LSGKKSYAFVKGDLKHGDADHVFGGSGHYFKVFLRCFPWVEAACAAALHVSRVAGDDGEVVL
jgi:hypothetical protein